MSSATAVPRRCPECGEPLRSIRILDEAGHHKHIGLTYTAGDAARSRWTGRYPVSGPVQALMCAACGRILLYGALPSVLAPCGSSEGRGDEATPAGDG
jgi:hypothetical protein